MKNHRLFMNSLAIFIITLIVSACTTTTIQTRRPTDSIARVSVAERNYALLNQALPTYQEAAQHPWETLPSDARLKPGAKNKTVLALRARLRATGELRAENDSGTTLYDQDLTTAVKLFQFAHGLETTGAVGPGTLRELNVSADDRLKQLQVNIDRWAKLSHELGKRFIMVNVPDYRLQVFENGRVVLSMRAIVGKPERPTPEVESTIKRIVFNPYWNVPRKIAQQDIVPKVIQNPDYLSEMHIEILDQQSDDAITISPDEVDWQSALENGFPYHFRQDPGNDNALGIVKFEFANSHDVYLHDTPAKSLFDKDKRDFSSGCIRLEDPLSLANYLMKLDPEWDDEKMQEVIDSGKTSYMQASMPTEIVIAYLTAWVDEYGTVQFRDDVYQVDTPLSSDVYSEN